MQSQSFSSFDQQSSTTSSSSSLPNLMTQQQPPDAPFVRSTQGFPRSALDRAAASKLRLEHNYKVSLQQAIERNQR